MLGVAYYLCHGRCRLHCLIAVVAVSQASSVCAESSPGAVVPCQRENPAHSRVEHLHSVCTVFSLRYPHLLHPHHQLNFHNRSDSLEFQPVYPDRNF